MSVNTAGSSNGDFDLDQLRNGDLSALDRILARNQERLRRIIESRIRGDAQHLLSASDVMQSAFLRVLKGVRAFQGTTEEQFTGWVVRIIENTITDRRRYLLAKRRRPPESLEQDPIDPRTRAGGGHRASSPLNFSEEFSQARAALDGIKPEYQEVFLLRVVENKSHAEIAKSLGKTEEAVRVQFARARAAFLAKLQELRSREL